MKMKNMLIGGMSLALVACISIGGTLAYLTATDDAVINTFDFANGMTVTLDEQEPTPILNEKIDENENGGYDYTNVVPGQTLNKAPEFTVTTTVDAYVFARVTEGENMAIGAITEGWTKLEGVVGVDNVWYKAVNASATSEGVGILQNLGTLFTQVTVGDVDLAGTEDLGNIKIEVAAIQQSGFESAADAYEEAVFQGAGA